MDQVIEEWNEEAERLIRVVGKIYPDEATCPDSALEGLLASEAHSMMVEDIAVLRAANGAKML